MFGFPFYASFANRLSCIPSALWSLRALLLIPDPSYGILDLADGLRMLECRLVMIVSHLVSMIIRHHRSQFYVPSSCSLSSCTRPSKLGFNFKE
jgi:hypothetical protein